MGLFDWLFGGRSDQSYVRGTKTWHDPPDYRPERRASDSIGRKQKYGRTGKKRSKRPPKRRGLFK